MTNTVQIPNDQMIFSVQELKDKGFSYYKINQMVDKGILIKLNKKYYENVNFDGEESDFYYAYAFVPDGVVCLLSAAVYYNLSTYRPDAIDVAIPRKAKVSTLPDQAFFDSLLYFGCILQFMLWRNEAAGIVSLQIGVGYRISGVINFTDIDSAELEFLVYDIKSIILTNSAF